VGGGFDNAAWERLKDFNKNAADPNRPDVKFTLEGDSARAREIGKLGGQVKPSKETKELMSVRQKLRWAMIHMKEGDVRPHELELISKIHKSKVLAEQDILATISDLEAGAEELPLLERLKMTAVIAKLKQDFVRERFKAITEAEKKLSVDSVADLISNAESKKRERSERNEPREASRMSQSTSDKILDVGDLE
jgi:hypothetical protein